MVDWLGRKSPMSLFHRSFFWWERGPLESPCSQLDPLQSCLLMLCMVKNEVIKVQFHKSHNLLPYRDFFCLYFIYNASRDDNKETTHL